MSQPTMEDVAQLAGVSRSLVSLVMRDSPKVSKERRTAVLEAAASLGYRPNVLARNLASRRTMNLGVLVNDLHNPFYAEAIDGILEAADEAGYHILMATGRQTAAGEKGAIETFLRFRFDGLILAGTRLLIADIDAAAAICPTVLLGRPDEQHEVDTVVGDENVGAGLAVQHLLDLGHTAIAHIDGGTGAGAAARRDGYVQAMRTAGLASSVQIAAGDFTESSGATGALKLLRSGPRPTAIFAANDLAAVGALDAIEGLGLRVPRDVSLIGYDNTAISAVRHVSLTTVDQPREMMGRISVKLLIDRIENGRTTPVNHVVTPTLVTRSSTAPPTATTPAQRNEPTQQSFSPKTPTPSGPDGNGTGRVRHRRPTIVDVAATAGVSRQTVSRVLSGGDEVAPHTHAQVTAAIGALGYRPNHVARNLVQQRSRILGVAAHDLNSPLTPPFIARLQALSRPLGYHVMVSNFDLEDDGGVGTLDTFVSLNVDGIALFPSSMQAKAIERFASSYDGRIVAIGRTDAIGGVHTLSLDEEAAANLVVEHLIGTGREKVAIFANELYPSARHPRIAALESHLADAGYPTVLVVRGYESTVGGGALAMSRLIEDVSARAVDAVVAFNDSMAIGALHACRDLGLSVPKDIALVGYDNLAYAAVTTPSITTIPQDAERYAQIAFDLLVGEHDEFGSSVHRVTLVPPVLEIRGTS